MNSMRRILDIQDEEEYARNAKIIGGMNTTVKYQESKWI
jgi:hypothetical protein